MGPVITVWAVWTALCLCCGQSGCNEPEDEHQVIDLLHSPVWCSTWSCNCSGCFQKVKRSWPAVYMLDAPDPDPVSALLVIEPMSVGLCLDNKFRSDLCWSFWSLSSQPSTTLWKASTGLRQTQSWLLRTTVYHKRLVIQSTQPVRMMFTL